MANKNKIGASIVLEGEKEFNAAVKDCNRPVSYTHLTLPTILLV